MSISYAGKYELKQVNSKWCKFYVEGKEIGAFLIGKGGVYHAANHFGK